jgi:hypothetical protein
MLPIDNEFQEGAESEVALDGEATIGTIATDTASGTGNGDAGGGTVGDAAVAKPRIGSEGEKHTEAGPEIIDGDIPSVESLLSELHRQVSQLQQYRKDTYKGFWHGLQEGRHRSYREMVDCLERYINSDRMAAKDVQDKVSKQLQDQKELFNKLSSELEGDVDWNRTALRNLGRARRSSC